MVGLFCGNFGGKQYPEFKGCYNLIYDSIFLVFVASLIWNVTQVRFIGLTEYNIPSALNTSSYSEKKFSLKVTLFLWD